MKTLSRNSILETLQANREKLSKEFGVLRIGLFGSFARDEGTAQSDIDFLVEFDVPLENYIANRQALIDYLTALFEREVDIANPKSLKPFYTKRILNQAVYA